MNLQLSLTLIRGAWMEQPKMEKIEVTSLETEKTVYLEHIKKTQIYQETWSAATRIEYNCLQNEIELLTRQTNQLAERCRSIDPCLSKQRIIVQQRRNRRLTRRGQDIWDTE